MTGGRRGFRARLVAVDEAFTVSSPWQRAVAELAEQVNAVPPARELRPLPQWVTTTVGQPAPNPLVRPVGRVWQPPPARRNGRSYRRRQLRESPDGVLAIYDPARGGDRHRPWLVIDVPAGHRSHHRDQPLADRDVQDWTVLVRATGWTRTEQP